MPPLYRFLEITLYSLLNFLPCLVLALYPFRNRLRFKKPLIFALVAMITLIQVGIGLRVGLFPSHYTSIISLCSTLIYLAFYFIAVKAPFGSMLFTLLMLSNIMNLIVVVSKCIEGQLFPEFARQSYRITFSLVMFVVELCFLIPLFFYIKATYATVFEKSTGQTTWRLLWMIPATFYVIWYSFLYGTNQSSLEFCLHPSHSVVMLLINLGAMLIYHMVVYLIRTVDENVALSEKNHVLAMQNLQFQKLQNKVMEARQAKHDIRHHITLMQSYVKNQEYDKLECYLNHYQQSLPDDSTIMYCENQGINILLHYFAQQAQSKGIVFSVHTHVPENLRIPENDLSVLLGNLLENALDACCAQHSGLKQIIIKAKTSYTTLFFTIDNSYDCTIRQDRHGHYLSTKKNGTGLGLVSVQSIVEHYDGNLTITPDPEMFRVSVMLNLPIPQ